MKKVNKWYEGKLMTWSIDITKHNGTVSFTDTEDGEALITAFGETGNNDQYDIPLFKNEYLEIRKMLDRAFGIND